MKNNKTFIFALFYNFKYFLFYKFFTIDNLGIYIIFRLYSVHLKKNYKGHMIRTLLRYVLKNTNHPTNPL